jgi:hypothetical protein
VCARNNTEDTVVAKLCVDGQSVDAKNIKPRSEHIFADVAVASDPKHRRELLFSLPRFATRAEKQLAGGKSLTPEQTAALGTNRSV